MTKHGTVSGCKPDHRLVLRDLLLGCLLGVIISMGYNLNLKSELHTQRQALGEKDDRISALERTVSANAVEWRMLMSEPIGLFLESKTGDVIIKVPYSKAPVNFTGVCRPETTL